MNETDQKTLYQEAYEHDACGIGAVVSIDGVASHSIVNDALSIVERLEHRAGKDASGETGDGVGILLQISHSFFGSPLYCVARRSHKPGYSRRKGEKLDALYRAVLP